jgi:exopolyphosphatase/guanosine-5'-triphosphate,3'-diphosphate pyrophosphatase
MQLADSTSARHSGSMTYAALDLGTNNCRLLIGTPTAEGFRVLESFSRVVRLGEGLRQSGCLSPQAMDRAVEALQACADRLARRRMSGMRAIATEACRQATNSGEFVARVARQTGLQLDVISTREEATLALESCAPLLAGEGRRALLFDIGGGSTELVWVRLAQDQRPELIGTMSMPVGVVGLSEQYGAAAFTERGFTTMVADVTARLHAFEGIHRITQELRHGGVRLLGTSGTVTTLAGEVLALERYRRVYVDGQVLSREAAAGAVAALRRMGRDGLAAHPCVGPERADFVLAGCAIYTAIHTMWSVPEVTVADRGLREGMLLRLIRHARHRAARS